MCPFELQTRSFQLCRHVVEEAGVGPVLTNQLAVICFTNLFCRPSIMRRLSRFHSVSQLHGTLEQFSWATCLVGDLQIRRNLAVGAVGRSCSFGDDAAPRAIWEFFLVCLPPFELAFTASARLFTVGACDWLTNCHLAVTTNRHVRVGDVGAVGRLAGSVDGVLFKVVVLCSTLPVVAGS